MFLIHIKSDDPEEGLLLADHLMKLPGERLSDLIVYGGNRPIAALKELIPDLRVMSKSTMKKALILYMLVGWTGYVPSSMRGTFICLPERYARFLWGWPHRFVKRMKDVGSCFVLVAGDGEWFEGYDTIESLRELPLDYKGGIWTNRIDIIGPVYK